MHSASKCPAALAYYPDRRYWLEMKTVVMTGGTAGIGAVATQRVFDTPKTQLILGGKGKPEFVDRDRPIGSGASLSEMYKCKRLEYE